MTPLPSGEIHLWIEGTPRSTQTGSVVRVRRPWRKDLLVPMRRGTEWARRCKLEAIRQYRGKPLTGAVAVTILFVLPLPKAAKSTRAPATKRPDVDGLAKGLLDAWNGVLWLDDAQVTWLSLRKIYSVEPGVMVRVMHPPDQPL